MFGSGGHLRPPGAGDNLLTYYTKCTEPNYGPNIHVKSIVQPRYAVRALDPHSFTYTEGHFAVSSDFERVMATHPVKNDIFHEQQQAADRG